MARAQLLQRILQLIIVEIDKESISALSGKSLGTCQPDSACATGNQNNPPRQGWRLGLAQLGLLQRPIFHVEDQFIAHRVETTAVFAIRHD